MPYHTNDDLPPTIRLRVAWAAVKRQYEKLNERWVPRDRDW